MWSTVSPEKKRKKKRLHQVHPKLTSILLRRIFQKTWCGLLELINSSLCNLPQVYSLSVFIDWKFPNIFARIKFWLMLTIFHLMFTVLLHHDDILMQESTLIWFIWIEFGKHNFLVNLIESDYRIKYPEFPYLKGNQPQCWQRGNGHLSPITEMNKIFI